MPTLSTPAKNARLDALTGLFNVGTANPGGLIRIYTTGGPETGTLLGTLTMSVPAFPAASGGTVSANPVAQDNSADVTGTAAIYVSTNRDGTEILRGSVSDTNGTGEMKFNTVNFVVGGPIVLNSFVLSEP